MKKLLTALCACVLLVICAIPAQAAEGNVTYVGHPKSYVNSNTGRNEFYWYSNTASQSVGRQYANDYLSQGGYSGN